MLKTVQTVSSDEAMSEMVGFEVLPEHFKSFSIDSIEYYISFGLLATVKMYMNDNCFVYSKFKGRYFPDRAEWLSKGGFEMFWLAEYGINGMLYRRYNDIIPTDSDKGEKTYSAAIWCDDEYTYVMEAKTPAAVGQWVSFYIKGDS